MIMIKRLMLKRQLARLAASKNESKELQNLAHDIEALELPRLSADAKARIAAEAGFAYHPHRKAFIRSWESALAVFIILIVVFAQSAKPGSALYSVKKGTDKVRAVIPLLHNAGTGDSRQNEDTQHHETNGANDHQHQAEPGKDIDSGSGHNDKSDSSSTGTGSGSSHDSSQDVKSTGSSDGSSSSGSGDSHSDNSNSDSGKINEPDDN